MFVMKALMWNNVTTFKFMYRLKFPQGKSLYTDTSNSCKIFQLNKHLVTKVSIEFESSKDH